MKMSIHRALSELKMLDKRISRQIEECKFVGCKKKSDDKVYGTSKSKNDFINSCKSELKSTTSLIDRYMDIKRKVTISNAITLINVGDKEMSVAEAIEYKKIIEDKKTLLKCMETKYNAVSSRVIRSNEDVGYELNEQIRSLLGSDKAKGTSGVEEFSKTYREQHEWEIIDAIGIEDEIKKIKTEIEDFESNIDFSLSESNALTYIEIDD